MLKLITDTGANLPEELTERLGIDVLPLHYGVETGGGLLDLTNAPFNGKDFYEQMRRGAVIKTSMVSIGSFLDVFEPYLAAGTDVIYIGISGGISSTYSTSMMAVQELREKYPERKIAAVNTRAASLGEGLPVLYAAKLLADGASFEELVRGVVENAGTMWQYFTVDDLMYLKRGGRVSALTAVVGNLLGIKPILWGNENGEIVLHGKARGEKRALETLVELYKTGVTDLSAPAGIAHADNPAGAEYVIEGLRAFGFSGEMTNVCYEPVTGAHVGPGTVALFFYGQHR